MSEGAFPAGSRVRRSVLSKVLVSILLAVALLAPLIPQAGLPAGGGAAQAAGAERWEVAGPPPARYEHTAVWDPGSSTMLIAGGYPDEYELWNYNPATGKTVRLTPEGDRPYLTRHTAVWDPTNNQMLVFGGCCYQDALYSYRPATNRWTQLTPTGATPPGRYGHTAVWDPTNNQMLVFGGCCIGGYFNDLWSYKPATNAWIQITAAAPLAASYGHTAVWDSANNQMLVFGGCCDLNDLWSYRPTTNTWTKLGAAPSLFRREHTAVWDSTNSRMLVFGGCCYQNDLWSYDPAADTWSQLTPSGSLPNGRYNHAAVWDLTANRMLIYGGSGGCCPQVGLGDIWSYASAANTWTRLDGSRPSARRGHAAAWDATGRAMLLFGGTGSGGDLNDLHRYDLPAGNWTPLTPTGTPPPARQKHSAAWDVENNRLLAFGGLSGGAPQNDLWIYNPTANAWTLLTPTGGPPPARSGHTAVWNSVTGTMLVFGGVGTSGRLDDLWSYHPGTNAWMQVPYPPPTVPPSGGGGGGGSAPPACPPDPALALQAEALTATTGGWPGARDGHSAVWDSAANRMLVFAGTSSTADEQDLWSYDPASSLWTRLAPSGALPVARNGHAAVWDSVNWRMLVFGGNGRSDLWAYSPGPNAWSQLLLADAAPGVRQGHTAVFDPVGRQMVMFGGNNGSRDLDDLWLLVTDAFAALRLAPQQGQPGATIEASGTNFTPSQPVTITLNGVPMTTAPTAVTPGEAGAFSAAFTVPGDARAGLMTLRASQSGGAVAATAVVTVLAAPPAAIALTSGDRQTGMANTALAQPLVVTVTSAGGAPVASVFVSWTVASFPSCASPVLDVSNAMTNSAGRSTAVLILGSEPGIYQVTASVSGLTGSPVTFTASAIPFVLGNDRWESPGPPAGRYNHTAVWDSANHQMLVLGGYVPFGNCCARSELWSYSPAAGVWKLHTPVGDGPGYLQDHTAVWDSTNQQMLVFGGSSCCSSSGYPNSLWSYKPATDTWTALKPSGDTPSYRTGHTAVWDPTNNQMLIYGGCCTSAELWSYSAATNSWRQISVEAPPGRRYQHVAVWDSASLRMLLWGGCCDGNPRNTVWAYQPSDNTWTALSPSGNPPVATSEDTAVWDPARQQMLVFGGCCYSNDLRSYSPLDNAWLQINPTGRIPVPRYGQSAMWDPTTEQMLVFGGLDTSQGCCGNAANDLWGYQPASNSWTELPSDRPSPRRGHTLTLNTEAAPHTVLLFGGVDSGGDRNDLQEYRPAANSWMQLTPQGPAPTARAEHTAVWDDAGRQLLVFGGRGDGVPRSDLWAYRPGTGAWVQLTPAGGPPPARSGHTAVWDPAASVMLVFGGMGASSRLDDLWRYDPVANTWALLTPQGAASPGARDGHTAVWDGAGNRMLVFAGTSNTADEQDLWSYDAASNAWTALSPATALPAGRRNHSAVWEPVRRRMIVFGGTGRGDMWSYSAVTNAWAQLAPAGTPPVVREGHGVAYDPGEGRMFMFGGSNFGRNLNELWFFVTHGLPAGQAAAIMPASGDGQNGPVNTTLPRPLVVTVTDANGMPVSGVTVNWSISAAPANSGAFLHAPTAITNVAGQASTFLRLGNSAGGYRVAASVSGLAGSPVAFTATAGPVIFLSPNTGAIGTAVTVTGSGFVSQETVRLYWDRVSAGGACSADGMQLASVTASGTGGLSASFTVPYCASLGDHTVLAVGVQTASAYFRVSFSPPAIVSPPEAERLSTIGATLTWINPPGAAQVQIQVTPYNGDGPGVNLVLEATNIYVLAEPVVGQEPYLMLPDMTYTWRVRVTDRSEAIPDYDASWSPWVQRTFRTRVATTDTVRLVAPADGSVTPSAMPTLRWENEDDGIWLYEIQLSKDPSFTQYPPGANAAVLWYIVNGSVATPVNSWTPSLPLEANTTYYWRVRPRAQGNGAPLPWSRLSSFLTTGQLAGSADWSAPVVVSNTPGRSGWSRAVADSTGAVHSVWHELVNGNWEVFYASRPAGGVWTAPVNLSRTSTNSQAPTLAVLRNGDLHVVWEENLGSNWEILWTTRPTGGTWSPPANISNTVGISGWPHIVGDAADALHLVWEDNSVGNFEVLYMTKGLGQGWAVPINLSLSSGDSFAPSLAERNGDLHVIWTDNTPDNFDILSVSKLGSAAWTAPVNLSNSSGMSGSPSLTTDRNGTVHAVWNDDTPGNFEVFAASKPRDGNWSEPVQLSRDADVSAWPAIGVDSAGKVSVFWQSEKIGTSPRRRILSAIHPDGGNWSAAFPAFLTSGTPQFLSMMADCAGQLHLTWQEGAEQNDEEVIYTTTARGPSSCAGLRLQQVSGDSQSAPVGVVAPQPLVVRVANDASQSASGVVVTFTITGVPSGATGQRLTAGSMTDTTVTVATDNAGTASATLTLGSTAGPYAVSATCLTCAAPQTVFFTTTASVLQPDRVQAVTAGPLTARIRTLVSPPLAFRVVSPQGIALPGVTLTFTVAAPAGAQDVEVAPATATTDAQGQAATRLLLGSAEGRYTVTAACAVCSSVTTATLEATATSFYAAAVLADAPVGYWRLGESGGTAAKDLSGNSNGGGTYVNGVTLGVAGALALESPAMAISLDGANDYLTVPDSPSLSPTGGVSVEAWVNVNAYSGSYPRLLSKAGAYELTMYTPAGHEGRLEWKVVGPTGTEYVLATAVADRLLVGQWYHVAATYDGATLRIYLNGVEKATKAVVTAVRDTASALTVSRADRPIAAKVDEVAVYGAALPASRVAAHYRAGRPGPAAALVQTTGNGQSGPTSAVLAAPFVVTATDADGYPISGVPITWVLTPPSGATGQTLTVGNATTDASGRSAAALKLGNLAGVYTVAASAVGLTGSPVTFTATALGSVPTVRVYFDPNPAAVGIGSPAVDIAIKVDTGEQPVDSIQFRLTYDATKLQVVDGDGNAANGTQLIRGPAFDIELLNAVSVDGATGTITFAAGRGSGQAAPAGLLHVATVKLRGLAEGSWPLTFAANGVEAFALGNALPVDPESGLVQVAGRRLVFAAAPVRGAHGQVLGIQPSATLQTVEGATLAKDNSTIVTLGLKAGTGTLGAVLTCAQTVGGVTRALASSGQAAFSGCVLDPPGVGYVLVASTGDTSVESPPFNITFAGDLNGDCRVTAGDFSLLVTHFGKTSADADWTAGSSPAFRADITGDNRVYIDDFSLLVSRFGAAAGGSVCAPPSSGVALRLGTMNEQTLGGPEMLASTMEDAAWFGLPAPAARIAAAAAAPIVVRATAAASTLTVGQTTTITLTVDAGAQTLGAMYASLTYPSDLVEVLQVTPGTALPTVLLNQINAPAGRVSFAAGIAAAQAGPSGVFTLAQVEFRGRAPGQVRIEFVNPTDAAISGILLPVTPTGAALTVTSTAPGVAGGGSGGSSAPAAPVTPAPAGPITPPSAVSGTVDATKGGTQATANVAASLPAGVVSGGGTLTVAVSEAPTRPVASAPAGALLGTTVFEVALRDSAGNEVHRLDQAASLTARLTASDLALAGGDPARLRLQRYDDVQRQWVDLGGTVDLSTMTIAATTDHFSLFAVAAVLPVPTLTGPADGALSVTMDPTLVWESPAGAQQYQVQILPFNQDGPGINLIIGAPELVQQARFAVSAPHLGVGNYILLPGMSYAWRVRTTPLATPITETDPGWSSYSPVRMFRTASPTSATITPVDPAPSTAANTSAPVLRWTNANARIFYYEIQLSADPQFVTDPAAATAAVYWELVHGGTTEPLNSYVVKEENRLQENATYYWRVRPRVQGDGVPVAWSETWNFRTP